jgi:hypothetical protein
LHVGDKFSVPDSEAPTDDQLVHTANLCVESGDFSELKLSGERKAFESAGQDAKGSWEHRIGNSNYSTGTPWQHPNDPRFKNRDQK